MKFFVPEMEATFGRIVYAGKSEPVMEGFGRDARQVGNRFALVNEHQADMAVIVPASFEPKGLKYKDDVVLIEPVVKVVTAGHLNGANQRVNYHQYELHAKAIVKKGETLS